MLAPCIHTFIVFPHHQGISEFVQSSRKSVILLHTWAESLNSETDQIILWNQSCFVLFFLDDIDIEMFTILGRF